MVFLVGEHAYKVKRPVRYDYLDFSTLDARRAMLRRELELNKPGAPEIYLGLVPVTRGADGGLKLGGESEVAEWCLHMRRFPKGAELSEVAGRGELTLGIAEDIGCAIAELHARAEIRDADGRALVAEIAGELDSAFSGMTDVFGAARINRFRARVAARIDAQATLLSDRGRAGHVRRGHGDLHLGNMVLLDGRPVPFDALEFDERLGTLDVLYDLAFALMDLLHCGFPVAANAVLGAYLIRADQPDHLDGLAALPLFLGLRAGIRAMVSVQAAQLADDAAADFGTARKYLDHALDYLAPPPPRLVAIGGYSGTGKTTLARQLAPGIGAAPGAIHLRSDLQRKALFGVDPMSHLPDAAYSEAAGRRVYAHLLDDAERILKAGHSVILDAVHARAEDRRRVAELARRAGVAMTGLWLQADEDILVARVTERRGDASDADAEVVRKQLATRAAAPDWVHLETGGALSATLDAARAAIARGGWTC
ncbi:kinase [Maritimibacter sp. 55A14]|nr:kinase [Maritimibacter sp. 55A14]